MPLLAAEIFQFFSSIDGGWEFQFLSLSRRWLLKFFQDF
jgi:hypothetical protein